MRSGRTGENANSTHALTIKNPSPDRQTLRRQIKISTGNKISAVGFVQTATANSAPAKNGDGTATIAASGNNMNDSMLWLVPTNGLARIAAYAHVVAGHCCGGIHRRTTSEMAPTDSAHSNEPNTRWTRTLCVKPPGKYQT